MNKLVYYLKFVGIFLIFELMISFIVSLLNLISLNSGIVTIILLVCNVLLFLILNIYNGIIKKKNGIVEGIIMSFIFIFLIFLLKIIFFKTRFNIATVIYYIILLLSGIVGGMIGVNKKNDK